MDLKKLILLHPLTNFEIQKYYQNEVRFNRVYSRVNLPNKIKDGTYEVNPDDYSDAGTLWIPLYALTLFRMGVGQKGPSTSFSSVTSTNTGIRPQNFLTFSFNPFATLM